MLELINGINRFIWGVPALILILGVGIFLSIRTGFAQIVLFPAACRSFLSKLTGNSRQKGHISAYQALCTALAATVGTGNLAGVAGAIAIGGPGAVFWMWVCAIFGMITKYAEATLAVRYRIKDSSGELVGGPMYMMIHGMGLRWKWLAAVYCFLGVVASFGVGNATQVNTMIRSIDIAFEAMHLQLPTLSNLLLGGLFALMIGFMLLGGAIRIGNVAERLVPLVSAVYLLLCLGVLLCRGREIPNAFSMIFKGAFSPQAVTGGALGSTFTALRIGASRGVFTNEAGMGTASMAHAAADVKFPAEQGLMGIMEVFLDTIVICTLTALVILCSGVPIRYGQDPGILLTLQAFSSVYGEWICVPISMALCCFALATVLGWGLYGGRCAQFLFGVSAWKGYVLIQVLVVMIGAAVKTELVWTVSEIMNGLMALPNLIALAWLSPELTHLTKALKYTRQLFVANGGTHEDIGQSKSKHTFTYAQISPFGSGSGKAG